MDKETYPDQRVVVLSQDLIFTRINGKKDTLLAQQYKITGYPTAIVANPKGEEIDRIVGFYPAVEFATTVKDYIEGKNTLASLESQYAKSPDDFMLNYKLGDKYLWRSEYEKAADAFQRALELDRYNKSGKADSAAYYLAMVAFRQKNYTQAVAQFENTKKLFPTTLLLEDIDIYIAVSYERAGDREKAIKSYQKYLDAYPEGVDRDDAQKHLEKLKQQRKSEGSN